MDEIYLCTDLIYPDSNEENLRLCEKGANLYSEFIDRFWTSEKPGGAARAHDAKFRYDTHRRTCPECTPPKDPQDGN